MEIKFSFQGQDRPSEVIKKFMKFEVDVKDARELWPAIIRDFAKREEAHFAAGAFAPLTPGYKAWKDSHGGAGLPILTLTRNLRESLTDPARFVLEIGPQKLSLGTDVEYAKYHQYGYRTRGGFGRRERVLAKPAETTIIRSGHKDFQRLFDKMLERERRVVAGAGGGRLTESQIEREALAEVLAVMKRQGGIRVISKAAQYENRHHPATSVEVPPRPPLISNRAAYGDHWRRLAVRWVRDELREAGLEAH